MSQYRKLVITSTHESYLMRMRTTNSLNAFCERCNTDVAWLYINDAALFGKLPVRRIFQLIEAGELHFRETSDCQMLICHESLSRHLSETEN